MFIVTAKINRFKILTACLLAVALLSGACALLFHPTAEHAAFHTSLAVDSNEARLEYLMQYGWKLAETPLAAETILVPENVETSCASYCALQAAQGFHLGPYAGKEIERYTYEVLNYPTGETGVQAICSFSKEPSSAAMSAPPRWTAGCTGWKCRNRHPHLQLPRPHDVPEPLKEFFSGFFMCAPHVPLPDPQNNTLL